MWRPSLGRRPGALVPPLSRRVPDSQGRLRARFHPGQDPTKSTPTSACGRGQWRWLGNSIQRHANPLNCRKYVGIRAASCVRSFRRLAATAPRHAGWKTRKTPSEEGVSSSLVTHFQEVSVGGRSGGSGNHTRVPVSTSQYTANAAASMPLPPSAHCLHRFGSARTGRVLAPPDAGTQARDFGCGPGRNLTVPAECQSFLCHLSDGHRADVRIGGRDAAWLECWGSRGTRKRDLGFLWTHVDGRCSTCGRTPPRWS
jgi:hypothetical protein